MRIVLINGADGYIGSHLIELLLEKRYKVKVIKLSGNFGSYDAILSGMNYTTGDCNVILYTDLQDPSELIIKMYEYWIKAIKLVIANRQNREDSFFQRIFSTTPHFLLRKYALKGIPSGRFDLVLFDKQLRDEVVKINEKNTNQIYLLSWLRYDFVDIPYTRKKRELGKSRWTLQKKIKLFVDSFVSFSFLPIRMISIASLILGLVSFFYGINFIYAKLTRLVLLQS